MKKKSCKRYDGITLVALIITIIIMLILATVTVGAINGGLFDYARRAKVSTEDASIMERIQKAFILAKGESRTNVVTENDFQKQVDKALPDENADVEKEGNEFVVLIGEKYYVVTENGIVNAPQVFEENPNAGDITKGKDGTVYTGTQNNPYRIECIEDLVAFSTMVATVDTTIDKPYNGKYVELTTDLDFNSIFSYANYKAKYSYIDATYDYYIPDSNSTTTIKELCTTGKGFVPIGHKYTRSGSCWWGSFDGKGHTIKNIYINREGIAGLFGGTGESTTIENLTIDGHIISTESKAAGIVINGAMCTVKNCCNKAKVEGKLGAGGIAYIERTAISDSSNYGEIISSDGMAYGITYVLYNIKNCRNYGNVTGKGNSAGICRQRLGWSKWIFS